VAEAERALGLHSPDASWYRDMWSRSNAPAAAPDGPVELNPPEVEALHQELLNVHKELAQLGFAVSGANVVASRSGGAASEGTSAALDQFGKVMRKLSDFLALFEKNFGVKSAPHRLLTGVPAGPVTFSPDEAALFQRQLSNLEQDIHEQLGPLLELSRIARTAPEELQSRAEELAPSASKIAAIVQKFGSDFDKVFGLQRGS
jgi:hypothetical protein